MLANDIALIGLAVMGQNLALNMARNGFAVTIYNRTWEKTESFMTGPGRRTNIIAARDLVACVASLKKPRKIFLMVKAGQAVDALLDELIPLLEPGDIVMDGGNSHFQDTSARIRRLEAHHLFFLGVGVSGGEQGALLGPSIMPGGPDAAWSEVRKILETIAARTPDGQTCAGFMGSGGAGHFVKMVHNGIEYAVMQLLAEVHDLLGRGFGLDVRQQAQLFRSWNTGMAASYLLEITIEILETRDNLSGLSLLDVIKDEAGSKGTGLWTTQTALSLGVPVPTITAAVDARLLSGHSAGRRAAAMTIAGPDTNHPSLDPAFMGKALLTATLIAYSQGLALIQAAQHAWSWGMDLSNIANVWRGGCIIRAAFLNELGQAYALKPDQASLFLTKNLTETLSSGHFDLRSVVSLAANLGVPAPALCASLAYYDSMRSPRLPSSLIQAQRDYFGAHGFERTDLEGVFHGPWTR